MTSLRLALAAAFAALALAGCSTNPLVAMGLKSPPPNPPTPLAPITATVTPRAIWTTQVGKSLGFNFRPVSQGGRIYAASGEGVITILDEDTGRVITKIDTKKRLSGGVEVGDGKIIAGTMKGEVVAYDVGGSPAWTTTVGAR